MLAPKELVSPEHYGPNPKMLKPYTSNSTTLNQKTLRAKFLNHFDEAFKRVESVETSEALLPKISTFDQSLRMRVLEV